MVGKEPPSSHIHHCLSGFRQSTLYTSCASNNRSNNCVRTPPSYVHTTRVPCTDRPLLFFSAGAPGGGRTPTSPVKSRPC